MNFLVVGANSVAGRNAIKAIRKYNENATVIGTTVGNDPIAHVDVTLNNIDLANRFAAGKVAYEIAEQPLHGIIYTPAFGKVGLPIDRSTTEDVNFSLNFSFRPMLSLIQKLQPEIAIAFSGFYWLEALLHAYGAMAMTKTAMEEVAIAYPKQLKIVRSGLFKSKSLRGILLLIQRTLTKDLYEELRPFHHEWRDSGLKFQEYFYEFAYRCERELFEQKFDEPYRHTTEDDIIDGVLHVLHGEDAPIYNVLGSMRWPEYEMPELPAVIEKGKSLIPDDLKPYFSEPAVI